MKQTFYTNTLQGARVDVSPLMAQSALAQKLLDIKGARILSFTTETAPKMLVTGNPYVDRVKKFARVNCLINFDYVKAFEKRTGETHAPTKASSYLPVFTEDGRKTPFQVNAKTQENLFVQLMSLNTESFYTVDGREVDKAILKPFFPASGFNPVNVRSYGIESLLELTVDGQEFDALETQSERLREILKNGLHALRARIMASA